MSRYVLSFLQICITAIAASTYAELFYCNRRGRKVNHWYPSGSTWIPADLLNQCRGKEVRNSRETTSENPDNVAGFLKKVNKDFISVLRVTDLCSLKHLSYINCELFLSFFAQIVKFSLNFNRSAEWNGSRCTRSH